MTNLCQSKHRFFPHIISMKILSILSLLIFLTSCAGGNVAKVKFGKRCTAADENGLKESSYVWVISKEALKSFDKRINKLNCSKS